jgi:hypothetical protein
MKKPEEKTASGFLLSENKQNSNKIYRKTERFRKQIIDSANQGLKNE